MQLVPTLALGAALTGAVACPVMSLGMAEGASFSLSLEVEGRSLLLVGNSSLDHDLRCDYEIRLLMAKPRLEEEQSPDMRSMDTPHGRLSIAVSDESLSKIGAKGILLPRRSVNRPLGSQELRTEVVDAELTQYGCRPDKISLPVPKDPSRHLQNDR